MQLFFQQGRALGTTFQFKADVSGFLVEKGAVTEPVQMFCPAMVVDMRPAEGLLNYYLYERIELTIWFFSIICCGLTSVEDQVGHGRYYQNKHGQLLFCITPDPPILGTSHDETSILFPQVCSRMVSLMPRLKNIRGRRVWCGLYPMTPDGSPFVSWNREVNGLLHATGMCGQGFMLGPGVGEIVARMVTRNETAEDRIVLEKFSLYRDVGAGMEALK
nr:FAD-binding oxidoreductase [uncultured Desulfobacter sp.]